MKNRIIFLFLLLSIFSSCNKESDDYVYYDNPPRLVESNKDYPVRDIFQDAKIDILFVVDNSGSMGDIQNNIIINSSLFMENFLKNNFMKWKMGIISTDRSDPPYLGFSEEFDHLYITKPNQNSTTVVQKFEDSMRRLGTSGDTEEFVFYNILRMMTDTVYSKFFRNDAHLAVIMVTDEEEQSQAEFGGQYEALSFVNAVKSFKNGDQIVRFYGALNFSDLKDCKNSWGPEYKDSPFEAVINETAGINMSACTADFGKKLAEIGRDIIRIVDSPRLLLKDRPKIETLKIYYEGKIIPSGKRSDGGFWFYSKKYNTINFYNLDFIKDFQNSNIRIEYDVNDGIPRD